MAENVFTPEFVHAGRDRRISIPKHYCSKVAWAVSVKAWLLVLVPGRFRLLSDGDVDRDSRLSEIRSFVLEGPSDVRSSPLEFETNEHTAVVGRLVPVPIDAASRFIVPKELLPSESEDRTFVLLFSSGYLEVWLEEVYRTAATCRLDRAL